MNDNVIEFPATQLEQTLRASIKRAKEIEARLLDGFTPARVMHDVPIARMVQALAKAGLTIDCKDGTIVIRTAPKGAA